MQTLFAWDMAGQDNSQWPEILRYNLEEFAPGIDDSSFAARLVEGVIKHQSKLDAIIEGAAPDWPLPLVAAVDRNVLRLGLYELLFTDRREVPAKVAINEAIELAKTFGGETSGKFVNGVLGTVYKELGEPGKDEVPARKKRVKNLPYEQMPVEKLGGAVVYAARGGDYCLALVHDVFGYWTLSKGHIEPNEDEQSAVTREIKKEINAMVTIKHKLGENEYIASDPQKGKIRKQVFYYLAEAPYGPLQLASGKGGLDAVRWFALSEVADLKIYDDILPIITKGIRQLIGQGEILRS